jgi:hypothetical protein
MPLGTYQSRTIPWGDEIVKIAPRMPCKNIGETSNIIDGYLTMAQIHLIPFSARD